jgi:uncharacterized protein
VAAEGIEPVSGHVEFLELPPSTRPGPSPVVHPDVSPFWAALSEGEFRLQQCRECGVRQFPPSAVCHACLSPDLSLVPGQTAARVATAIEVHRATGGGEWGGSVPYLTGLVQTEEGLRLPGRILCGCGEASHPGTQVSMCLLHAIEGGTVFGFYHACMKERPDDDAKSKERAAVHGASVS